MQKILYIEASPRKKRSSSIAVARFFLEAYEKAHSQDKIEICDLWKQELPEFDGDTIDAKYAIMQGSPHNDEQKKAWKKVEEVIHNFKSADKYVFSLPMWNFSIPYKLKHYLDLLVQPGYTFKSSSEGYLGLVTHKKALLIYSRGSAYPETGPAFDLDLQKKYMETILKFIGFEHFESIVVEPTLGGEDKKEHSLKQAQEQALRLASSF